MGPLPSLFSHFSQVPRERRPTALSSPPHLTDTRAAGDMQIYTTVIYVLRDGWARKRGRREKTWRPPRPAPTPAPPGQSLPCPSCPQDFATPSSCLGNGIARGGAAQQFPEASPPCGCTPPKSPSLRGTHFFQLPWGSNCCPAHQRLPSNCHSLRTASGAAPARWARASLPPPALLCCLASGLLCPQPACFF